MPEDLFDVNFDSVISGYQEGNAPKSECKLDYTSPWLASVYCRYTVSDAQRGESLGLLDNSKHPHAQC